MPELRIKTQAELKNIMTRHKIEGQSKRKIICPVCRVGHRYRNGDRWTRCDKCGFGGIL